MIRDYIRKDLKDIKPYHAPLKSYEIKIDANENPYNHNNIVIRAMEEWIKDSENIRRYPDTDCNELKETIASFWKVDKTNVACGVGSDQLIDCILKVFLEPSDKVLIPTPSFSMYQLSTKINHGIPIEFTLNNDYSYPLDKIIELYNKEKPKCVFLCTPNNPTGNTLSVEDMEKLVEQIKCPVIIDEAYGEFIDETMINKIHQYSNIIVLKTFSKSFGLAGLRVGYAIASKIFIEALNIAIPPYNVSSFSQHFAKLILENSNYYKDYVEKIINNREWLYEKLSSIKIIDKVFPSKANFILIKVNISGIPKKLEEVGILVRGYGELGNLAKCIRITVGTEEENKKLIEVLSELDS